MVLLYLIIIQRMFSHRGQVQHKTPALAKAKEAGEALELDVIPGVRGEVRNGVCVCVGG